MKATRMNNFRKIALLILSVIFGAGVTLATGPSASIKNSISYSLDQGTVSISYLNIHNTNDQENDLSPDNVEPAIFELSRNMKVNGSHINKGDYEVSLIETANGLGFNFHSLDKRKQADIQVALTSEPGEYAEFLNYSLQVIENDKIAGQINWKENKYTFSMEIALSNAIFTSLERKENEKNYDWMDYYQAAIYAYKNKIDLEKSYEWAEKAMKLNQNQYTVNLSILYLESMGQNTEAQQLSALRD
jgi:hypothetical protein